MNLGNETRPLVLVPTHLSPSPVPSPSSCPHRVVLGSHHGLRVAGHSIVDVRRPDSREGKHRHMGVVVARDEEEEDHVRTCLVFTRQSRSGRANDKYIYEETGGDVSAGQG